MSKEQAKPKKSAEPVFVQWLDATSMDEWQDFGEAQNLQLSEINTLGFMINEDAERVVVALSVDSRLDQCSQVLSIPKAWIQRVSKIRFNGK